MTIFRLDKNDIRFPSPRLAERDGILAVGGDLRPERLLIAYAMGIFPWFGPKDPLLWWSPDPRLVLFPDQMHISRRLRRIINRQTFAVSLDRAFPEVIRSCAAVHEQNDGGTWISKDMIRAYCRLHEAGWAHSVETWQCGELVGGLYGVAMGKCFFGESMFSRVSNASKVALAYLADYLNRFSFAVIDCQVTSLHLQRLGAVEIPRDFFLQILGENIKHPVTPGKWTLAPADSQTHLRNRSNRPHRDQQAVTLSKTITANISPK